MGAIIGDNMSTNIDVKVTIGYVLGIVAYIGCLVMAWYLSEIAAARCINLLLCIFGGTAGWVTGILITPKKGEAKDFEKIGGALLTFVTGFGVAKLDQLFGLALDNQSALFDELFIGRVLFAATTFLIGALFVFVGRRYWQDDPVSK